jgi:hypothetical protein
MAESGILPIIMGDALSPTPLGFIALRATGWDEKERLSLSPPPHPYSRLQWRSGHLPVLPYPPRRYSANYQLGFCLARITYISFLEQMISAKRVEHSIRVMNVMV